MAATKEKSQVLPIEQQTVKVTAAEAALKADNNTELQLRWCFQRRGDALDRCRLVERGLHQRWVQYLLGLLSKPAPDGYAKSKLDVSIPVPVHATVKSAPSPSGAAAANSGGKNGAKAQGKVRKEGKQSQRAKALCPTRLKTLSRWTIKGSPLAGLTI